MDTKLVREYIRANIDKWYDFAHRFYTEEHISEGSIVLIRGCDKAESWAAAVFHERSTDANVFFNGSLQQLGAGLKLNGSWSRSSSSTECQSSTPSPGLASIESVPSAMQKRCTRECQETVFVRIFKYWRRYKVFRIHKVIRAAASPHNLPRPDQDPSSSILVAQSAQGSEFDNACGPDRYTIVEVDSHSTDLVS
jgi:hypothetical protein